MPRTRSRSHKASAQARASGVCGVRGYNGVPCSNPPLEGQKRCDRHGGKFERLDKIERPRLTASKVQARSADLVSLIDSIRGELPDIPRNRDLRSLLSSFSGQLGEFQSEIDAYLKMRNR